MADEFQWGNCGGRNWWHSLINLFFSPKINDLVSLRLPLNHHRTITSNPVGDDSAGSASDAPIASFLPMGRISLSSSPTSEDWNRDLLHDSGRSEKNHSHQSLLHNMQAPNYSSSPNYPMISAEHATLEASDDVPEEFRNLDSAMEEEEEELGDPITALHQMISPFGKTDTASVLYETIGYIKFLNNQISVLSSPYSTNGGPSLQHQQTTDEIIKNEERLMQDLKGQGLCLVPISTTFPLAVETIFERLLKANDGVHMYEKK